MIITPNIVDHNTLTYMSESFTINKANTTMLFEQLLDKDVGYFVQCFESENDTILKIKCGDVNTFFLVENVKKVIGSQIELILLGFNNNQGIMAKVDTGASFCSLHAKDIKTQPATYNNKNEQVTFSYNRQEYRMPIINKQSVQNSDGGITYRPVVKFNVSMSNSTFEEVLFNLNDREDMTHDILLGQNLLKQSRVLVDPTLYMEGLVLTLSVPLQEAKTPVEKEGHDFDKFKNLTLQEMLNTLKTFNG